MTQNFEPIGVRLTVQGQQEYERALRQAQEQITAFGRLVDRDFGGTSTRFISRAEAMRRVMRELGQEASRQATNFSLGKAGVTPQTGQLAFPGLGNTGFNLPKSVQPQLPGFGQALADIDRQAARQQEILSRSQANASKMAELQQRRLAEADRRAAESRSRLNDLYREADTVTRASARATQQQTAAFAGLNPHMRTSIFYTQQIGAGFVTLRGGMGLAALGIATFVQHMDDAVKAAISFESEIAGINKVMGGTPAQIKAVADNILEMSANLDASKGPVGFTTTQLSDITTEASRAGIEGASNLRVFTEAIADVATASNLVADQAVRDFAHLSLALQEPPGRVRNLTSAVTALDNELPTSTAEITHFSVRIAAAAKTVGLASSDVFAIAAAMTSLGVQAEAGGTAVQRVLFAMAGAVREGGAELNQFAKISGLSAAQFAATWRADPIEAFLAFTEGLGRAGDQAQIALKGLELGDVRLIRSFVTTAGAGDLLRRSVELSAKAMEDGTLTNERARIVYQTTAAQVKGLENAFHAHVIELGQSLLPVYKQFLELIINNILPALDDLPQTLASVGSFFERLGTMVSGVFSLAAVAVPEALALMAAEGERSFARLSVAGAHFSTVSALIRGNALDLVLAQDDLQKANARLEDVMSRSLPTMAETERQYRAIADAVQGVDSRTASLISTMQLERSIRKDVSQFAGLSSAQLRGEISRIQESIQGYQALAAELDYAGQQYPELNNEIYKQTLVLDRLNEQLAETVKQENKFRSTVRPDSGLDFSIPDDKAADKARREFEKWKREFDSLTKTIQGSLIPAFRAAVSIIGEDFTGTVQRAAITTTAALTDAMLKQAAIIGGPYGQALRDVVQALTGVTAATRELGDVQDGQFQSAEKLIGQLEEAAESLQTIALAGGDTTAAAAQAQAAIDRLRTIFQRLTPEQQKAAGAILDAAQNLVDQAAAAGDNEDAQRVYREGIEATTAALKDYADASDEAIAADKRRADAAKTAEEKLVEAKSAETRANENLVKQNDRLAEAQKNLAAARASGDQAAIRAAQDEVVLARQAVQRAKERVRERREERKEAEVDVSEKGAAKGEGGTAADLRREELDEEAAARKRRERRLPAAERRRLAAFQSPDFLNTTVPLRLSSIPGVSSIPMRPMAPAASIREGDRSITIQASYVNQPEIEIKHDLQALSMLGLV